MIKLSRKQEIENEITRIRKTIKDFADKDLYSANCIEVKYLYKQLRELNNEIYEMEDDEDYEPYFIDGSDVPVCGGYE